MEAILIGGNHTIKTKKQPFRVLHKIGVPKKREKSLTNTYEGVHFLQSCMLKIWRMVENELCSKYSFPAFNKPIKKPVH